MASKGLRLSAPHGTTVVTPKLVSPEAVDAAYGVVLLSVKADALHAALEDLAPAIGEGSVIVPFLNGIDHIEVIEKRFPGHLLGGVVKVVAQLAADGTVEVSGSAASMEIGELTGELSDRARRTADTLDVDGYEFSLSSRIRTAMWHKWVFISTVAAICCTATGTIGDVASVPGGSTFATSVLMETSAISAAAGHPLSAAECDALRSTVTMAGSPFAPSLYRDMIGNRPTEVENVLASLSSTETRLGIPTPLIDLATLRLRLHNRRVASSTP
ncbi:2-dehydropantoate 2-reductase N-terminal domain-containing protein [Streptomyces sp. NPDC005794]|uniref:2-dehydropantoate 2-reductase N-terminal domain-containing protein n=1 Tax=Streptomyces sp. NPDC005794 TaxID=3364733 RepID=UPI00369B0D9D